MVVLPGQRGPAVASRGLLRGSVALGLAGRGFQYGINCGGQLCAGSIRGGSPVERRYHFGYLTVGASHDRASADSGFDDDAAERLLFRREHQGGSMRQQPRLLRLGHRTQDVDPVTVPGRFEALGPHGVRWPGHHEP